MEIREELQLSHPMVEAELLRRTKEYSMKFLGNKTKENRKAYENSKWKIIQLLNEKKEYRVPWGSYSFSTENKLRYRQAEEAGILAECILTFALKEYRSEEAGEQYLMHIIQISVMNAVRDYIKEVFVPQMYRYIKKEQTPYVGDFFGPGLFEEPLTTTKKMLALTKAKGISIMEQSGLMSPNMAFAGVIYVTERKFTQGVPCKSCKAKSGCEYCMKKR